MSEPLSVAELRQKIEDLARDKAIHENTIDYAVVMMRELEKLGIDFGSNNFYESCDQVVREVSALMVRLEHLHDWMNMAGLNAAYRVYCHETLPRNPESARNPGDTTLEPYIYPKQPKAKPRG